MKATSREGDASAARWVRGAAAAVLILAVAVIYLVRIRTGMVDFGVNYQAGRRLWAGITLYQTSDGHYMFKYLPSAALLYLPFAALPLEIAKLFWFAGSVAAMIWSFRLVDRLLPHRNLRHAWPVPALVLAKYFLRELRLGQINILVTLVMLMSVRALADPERRRSMADGLWAGVATALKPYAALLFPYLVLKRRWKSVAAGLAVLVAALALPSVFYGVRGNFQVLHQWATTLAQSTPAQLANNDNVSVLAFFTKWTGNPTLALSLTAVVLAVLAAIMVAVVVRGRGLARAPVLECGMALTLIPLVSPMGWDYTFLMALLAVTLIVDEFGRVPAAGRALLTVNFAVIGLTIYDIMGRHAYATFMQWSITTLNFVIVVAALAYLRFRRVC
jgi:alpha-1,2-mannosyltransferase